MSWLYGKELTLCLTIRHDVSLVQIESISYVIKCISVPNNNLLLTGPNSKHLQMTNVTKMMISVFYRVETIMGKRENAALVPAFSPFPTMFSKDLFLRVVKSLHHLVKSLTLSQTTNFRLVQTKRPLQTTILTVMKVTESSPNGKKTLWEKEKLLVTSNFSFSHSVFKKNSNADT